MSVKLSSVEPLSAPESAASISPLHRPAPVSRLNAIASGPPWALMPIGAGALEYRNTEHGYCLCRAVGADAVAASIRLLGPPLETDAEGYSIWKLYSDY
jgi:hypothetical protein